MEREREGNRGFKEGEAVGLMAVEEWRWGNFREGKKGKEKEKKKKRFN